MVIQPYHTLRLLHRLRTQHGIYRFIILYQLAQRFHIIGIGFDELSFLNCKFSERKNLRVDRVEKIVVSAMKQSRKPQLPVVNALCSFDEFIKNHSTGHRYIAHCYNEVERHDFFDQLTALTDDEPVTVLVGPEGDFSIEEVRKAVDNGYVSISLGKSRLRTETAGLSAVMLARLVKRIED